MEHHYSNIVIEAIRTEMAKKNIKANQLSEIADIPAATVSNTLSGKVSSPSFAVIYAMAKALGVTIDELMGDNVSQVVVNDRLIDGYEKRLAERREIYLERLDEQRTMYEARLTEQKDHFEARLANHKEIIETFRRRSIFRMAAIAVLVIFVIYLLFIDAKFGDWGFIQYELASLFGAPEMGMMM